MTQSLPICLRSITACAAAALCACGGGTANGGSSGGGAPVSTQVSGTSTFSSGCSNAAGESFTAGSAIQPQIAAIPGGALVGVWEQDRWSGLGARGILTAHSLDGGATWSSPQPLALSVCATTAAPGSGYDRASDPWVSFGGSGIVYASALAFSATGFLAAGGLSDVVVTRSTDGGVTWSAPQVVMHDTNPAGSAAFFFNDRDSITADPATGNAYLVWDRLSDAGSAPAYLSLWTNASGTWNTRILYDPAVAGDEAFNNEILVLPDVNGTVLDFFTLATQTSSTASLQVIRSIDHGATWSTSPVTLAGVQSVGTAFPSGPAIRDSSLMAQVAVDPNSGLVAAVWQQSFGGVAVDGVAFDGIALAVSKDGGATGPLTTVQINGVKTVAAFSPTVRYLPGGVLAVTYYDLRDYAAGSATLNTSAWLTESADGGATWHEVRLQSPFDLSKAPVAAHGFGPALFLGDNQGLAAVGGSALPFYAATNSAGAHVYATQAPDPLTLSTAHVYGAGAAGASLPATVQARAALNARQVMARRRAAPPSR
jgi:hypothetical protein